MWELWRSRYNCIHVRLRIVDGPLEAEIDMFDKFLVLHQASKALLAILAEARDFRYFLLFCLRTWLQAGEMDGQARCNGPEKGREAMNEWERDGASGDLQQSRGENVCDEAETRETQTGMGQTESSSGQKGGKGDKTSIQLIVHRLG